MDWAVALPDALARVSDALRTTSGLVDRAGPVGWLLVGLSIVALTLIIAKLWQFAGAGLDDGRTGEALRLLRLGRAPEAAALARGSAHPASRALALAIEGQRRALPDAMVREAGAAAGEAALDALRAWLRPLETVAALAPLVGLFGTVLGMIDAFAALERAGAQVDPALLSGGIWTALLTTAMGLGVAMPVVAALGWFERRIERAENTLDATLAAAFTLPLWQAAPEEDLRHGLVAAQG